ncbi:MAG: chromosomal replication initiator protein DnaA [Alphaproteobacteria bacterium]|nr:MAG: chromosomal replication initiator protein DnaA [Alphaproteobacteria bacterium]
MPFSPPPAAGALKAHWEKLTPRLVGLKGQKAYDNWLAWIEPVGHQDGTVTLALPNKFMRDWIKNNYGADIGALLCQSLPHVSDIRWVVHASDAKPAPTRQPDGAGAAADGHRGPRGRFGTPLDERFTFDSFVVGRPNQFCYAAARKVAELQHVEFNPLFIYGGVGLGKTHLMHAIAWEAVRINPRLKLLYLSAERFMYAFINALRYDNILQFKEKMRSVDLLLIDDMHFLVGKESTQEEFFHLFNYLIDNGKQIVLSADRAPGDIEGLEERIKSRLAWGLVADVHPTDYELRLSILELKAQRLRTAIPDDVLGFLAKHITANVRELEGALTRVVAHAQLTHVAITLELARTVLQDILRANNRKITIEDIQKATAEHYNIRLADMLSARRERGIVRPRQVAMYMAKKLTTLSLPDIARAFRGRDHTTVLYAVNRIDELRQVDNGLEADIRMLTRRLEG